MRIDLHTHSDRSDGSDPPAQLVANAAAAGLDVLALTDHDTTAGWAEATAAARDTGLGLLPGLEISTTHDGTGVHLLAYLPDPDHEPLRHELQRILDGRASRLPSTLERLREVGIEITADDVRRAAGPAAAMGRPHVADALIDLGVVANRDEAFERFLSPGRPAYVDRYAADLVAMLDIVSDAGGATVIAHPWGRTARETLTSDVLTELARHGLDGIEADHQDHDDATRAELHELADRLGLVATGSSDYHGEGKMDCSLGCNTTAPDQLERLLDAAAKARTATGRGIEPVLP